VDPASPRLRRFVRDDNFLASGFVHCKNQNGDSNRYKLHRWFCSKIHEHNRYTSRYNEANTAGTAARSGELQS